MSDWWELYAASFPDGAELVSSRETPDRFRGFFRGEDRIGGHAEFSKVDLREPAAIVAAISLAAGVFGTVVVFKNAPRIKRWWEKRVVSTVQAAWRRIARQNDVPRQSVTAELAMLSESAIEDFSKEVDLALEYARTGMSSAEAQQHLFEILMAASIIADRMRKLFNARIEDDAYLPELTNAMEKLTTQQVTDTINRMLEANTSLRDDETSTIFTKIFGGGRVIDGEYVPLRNENLREALRLPGLEMPLPHDLRETEMTDQDSERPPTESEADV